MLCASKAKRLDLTSVQARVVRVTTPTLATLTRSSAPSMETVPNTSRLCGERAPLLARKISHKLASCSRAFQYSVSPPKSARRGLHKHIESSKLRVTAQAAEASVAFQSVDDSVWDDRYAEEGPLEYGLATLQGPRDEMEDYSSIVPRGRCGFLYAGTNLLITTCSDCSPRLKPHDIDQVVTAVMCFHSDL